jgi:hypothetical protein
MSEELVTVATYHQGMLAHAAKNFLAEKGIHAFIADEYTALESWSNFIEAKLQVSAADAERAMSLLAKTEP